MRLLKNVNSDNNIEHICYVTLNLFLYLLGNETPIKKLLNAKQYFQILITIEIKYF